MPKFGDLGSKFSKTNNRFEICTFEIRHMCNFVKIRELILLGPKYTYSGVWARNFPTQMPELKSAPSK